MSAPAGELTAADISVESLWPAGSTDPMATRARNAVREAGIETIGELAALSDDELRDLRNVGAGTVAEIRRALAEYELESDVRQHEGDS